MIDRVYVSRNYRSKYDAAGKAKIDCENVLSKNGWRNVGLPMTCSTHPFTNIFMNTLGVTLAFFRIRRGSVVCLQYPFKKFYLYSIWVAKVKKCRVITIVHDVRSLKGKAEYTRRELEVLSRSDC